MLTLAAMHVLNDTTDPYFTRLQPGAYAANKPSGKPCDAALTCHKRDLSKGARIGIGVAFAVVAFLVTLARGGSFGCSVSV